MKRRTKSRRLGKNDEDRGKGGRIIRRKGVVRRRRTFKLWKRRAMIARRMMMRRVS